MRLSTLIWRAFLVFLYPSILSTIALYFYPLWFSCDFPSPPRPAAAPADIEFHAFAPFRLLILADPQLEGDSSLPDLDLPTFPALQKLWVGNYSGSTPIAVVTAAKDFLIHDIPLIFTSYRKRLDLFGNDYYLAHIYRSIYLWSPPTHVAVLGDLIGSQWVSDGEFDWRGWRYWNRVFRGGERVGDEITKEEGRKEMLGNDTAWPNRVINIAGNHDIGYAGDIDEGRIERFRRVFGQENWDITFQLPLSKPSDASFNTASGDTPSLRLIILNSMNLDGPALSTSLQTTTYDFINHHILDNSSPVGDSTSATILLTHIPLHKAAGICVDSPFFDYGSYGVKEQNHLSSAAGKSILEGIYGMSSHADAPAKGMGRGGLILSGHDHAGCDIYHYADRSEGTTENDDPWKAARWADSQDIANSTEIPGIREITVRSMMGSYGGNAGLLSAWFDMDAAQWRFEYATCALGVQHIWWAVHVFDFVTVLVLVLSGLCAVWEDLTRKVTVANVKKRQ